MTSVDYTDVATAVYGTRDSLEKAKTDATASISVHEIFSQSTPSISERQSLNGATDDREEYLLTSPRYSIPPPISTRQKVREFGRIAYMRSRSTWNEVYAKQLPISDAGWYVYRYVKPVFSRAGANDRITTSMWTSNAPIADGSGLIQNVIQSASHNYAGFYRVTPASEGLQRMTLNCLPVANSDKVPKLEAAMHEGLRKLFNTEFCTTVSTGYCSNVLCFTAVLDETWVVVMDEKSHNSMFVAAYLAKPKRILKFRHNDMKHLEELLEQVAAETSHVLVAVEGAYSMDGTVPPVNELSNLKHKYNCNLLVDEAHSLLALGRTGRGCVEAWNDEHPENAVEDDMFDLRTATLSKSFGTTGGIVWGKEKFRNAILTRRQQLLDQGCDPLATSVMVNTLFILGQQTLLARRLQRLRHIVAYVRAEFREAGMHVYGNSLSPALPLHTGRPSRAALFSYVLRKHGVLATPITPPAVPFWEGRVRLCLSADFDNETVTQIVVRTVAAAQSMGLARKTGYTHSTFCYTETANRGLEESEIKEVSKQISNLILEDAASQSIKLVSNNLIECGHSMREKFGLGSGGSRWVIGTSTLHLDVERSYAALAGTEAAMTYADSCLGLLSTIAALCRPVRSYARHYFFVPQDAPAPVWDGFQAAPKKKLPIIEKYSSLSSLLHQIQADSFKRNAYITIYLGNAIADESLDLTRLVQDLTDGRRPFSTTILLGDMSELASEGLSINRAQDLCQYVLASKQEVLSYVSFQRAFGIPGAVLAGSSIMLDELRFTSRTYMFSTSQQSFLMGMILHHLQALQSV